MGINDFLVPAVFVALLGLILQGIKALLDIFNQFRSRKLARQQSLISLTTALFQLLDASSHTGGEKLTIKQELANQLLIDVVPQEIIELLSL
jgi:hypothetical protein